MSHDPREQSAVADGPVSVTANRYGADVVIVSLAGELDQSNVATAREAVFAAAAENEEILVIDLSALDFIDSSGIALLVAAGELCRGASSLRVLPSHALAVKRVLRLTGVDSMLHILRDHPAAAT